MPYIRYNQVPSDGYVLQAALVASVSPSAMASIVIDVINPNQMAELSLIVRVNFIDKSASRSDA